ELCLRDSKKGDYIIFAQPYEGSPADRAGIRIGDKILAIDGADAKGFSPDDVSSRLKGDADTEVTVVVERMLDGSRDTLTMRRERIAIPSIPYSGYVADGIGYIQHSDFTEGCYDQLREALERLQREGDLQALILDYRSNGGGIMQEAVKIASLFLPKGTEIVSTMGRDSLSRQTYLTANDPIAADLPLAVLINGSTASSSEILAGALQDRDRAVIIGQRSYGKGLVQGTRYLGYNSYLKLTTAKYYIPSGRCIQAVNYSERDADGRAGIVPDSLIREYRTDAGRKVYDGGGIVPDIKLEPNYVSRFALTLYAMGYMEDWADDYMRRNADRPIDVRTFSIDEADYDDFKAFIEQKDVPYESQTRHALAALRQAAKADLYDRTLEEHVAAIEALVKDDKQSNLETYRREIIDAINAEIVLRYAYQRGVIEHSLTDDEVVLKAIELLSDREEMQRILTEQDLPKH
ncbi:MAG: S41 family peptidase, partial [Alistipes sp.]|nr:S41 family peptidase [Alistipes sp.]